MQVSHPPAATLRMSNASNHGWRPVAPASWQAAPATAICSTATRGWRFSRCRPWGASVSSSTSRGLGWALLFALNPWTTLRTVGLALWELLRDIAHTLFRWLRDRFRHRLRLGKPFLKVLSTIIFGQIQTFGILLDVYRGMPAIYVDFYGYDEVAHEDGPLGREALRALKRIDTHISRHRSGAPRLPPRHGALHPRGSRADAKHPLRGPLRPIHRPACGSLHRRQGLVGGGGGQANRHGSRGNHFLL